MAGKVTTRRELIQNGLHEVNIVVTREYDLVSTCSVS